MRGLPDARKEGKKWYCSQGHFLDSAAAARAKWKPRRKWRRRIGWTLGITFALLVGLTALGAMLPSPSSNKKNSHRVATGLGTRGHPIPLHRLASIGGGWWVKVNGVTPNANALFRHDPPPPGARNYLINVTLTYRGAGKDDASYLVDDILRAIASHRASYETMGGCGTADSPAHTSTGAFKWPAPSLEAAGELFSGRSVRGNLCYQIATNDAKSLLLYATGKGDAFISFPSVRTVWFALRQAAPSLLSPSATTRHSSQTIGPT